MMSTVQSLLADTGTRFPDNRVRRDLAQIAVFISGATVLPVYLALVESSVVSREIKSVIRPLLQDAGFTQFTTRTAWRYAGERIDVVNFQSFNSFLANSLGCTTYSFCVRLGCSFDAIPRSERVKRKDEFFRPEEYECHFRRPLQKSIQQPNLKRTDVWYVDPAGKNLDMVIADAKRAILETGLGWFTRFDDTKEVLRTLLEDQESHESTSGFGANPSPIRHFMTGFIAHSMGKYDLARERIQKVLDSECFKEFEPKMHAALEAKDKQPG
jgi:hypothetical protein